MRSWLLDWFIINEAIKQSTQDTEYMTTTTVDLTSKCQTDLLKFLIVILLLAIAFIIAFITTKGED